MFFCHAIENAVNHAFVVLILFWKEGEFNLPAFLVLKSFRNILTLLDFLFVTEISQLVCFL